MKHYGGATHADNPGPGDVFAELGPIAPAGMTRRDAMRIALYQCPPLPLDPEANLARLHRQAAEAARRGARLLVGPEMYLSGYNIGREAAQTLAQPDDGPWAQRVAAIAREQGIAILYGYPERGEDGVLYNSAQLIDARGERLGNTARPTCSVSWTGACSALARRPARSSSWKAGSSAC